MSYRVFKGVTLDMKDSNSSAAVKSGLILILFLSFAGAALAEGTRKRIRFPRGSNSTTISGSVVRGEQARYILGAREGQAMTVRIKSVEDNAVFQIYLAGEQESLEGAGEGDDAKSWSGKLPATTDYIIVVGSSRGNASYKLEVKIE
jgi:hypothetical protein